MPLEAEERLFPIQAYDYETGICADGTQVVMGLLCPELVAFFFDSAGNLVSRRQQRWSDAAARIAGENPPYQCFSDEFDAEFGEHLEAYQQELGFEPATIRIKEFFDSHYGVGIEVLPDHFCSLENAEWITSEEERREYTRMRDEWLQQGNFVWWWARDYYMDSEGEVRST